MQPAELGRPRAVNADRLHGRQTIERISNASIGCDALNAARSMSNWEFVQLDQAGRLGGTSALSAMD